jgi:hypothetical protein
MNAAVNPTPPPSIIAALAERAQFIIYRRADKCPVHPEKLYPIDAQAPANWLRGDVAWAWAQMLGPEYGVGIVLYKGCGLACIDIDKAYDPETAQWSALATELCTRFAGAYIEVSQSGKGLHIFFTARGEISPHKKKNTAAHIELYDELRFIGLTGSLAAGDVTYDATALLPQLIADYFQPGADASDEGWTSEPAAAWDGPADDAELIRRMLASKSAGAIFGAKASAADLWTNNIDALAKAFPPQSVGKDYDASSADQAIANHFAFWTGGNCERIESLMRQSGLVRDKWDRDEYLRGTILKACAWQKSYYKQRDAATPAPPYAMPTATANAALPVASGGVLVMNRKAQYEATLEALVYVLGEQTLSRIGFDEFRDRVMVAPVGTEEWRPISDNDMRQLRETFGRELRFAPVGKELMSDALHLVAARYRFDSAITWLDGLVWDGVPRIGQFLTTHCGTADDEYSRAVSLYIWTGLAARVLEPGCQLDMVVAFQSGQGEMKSTGLQAMVPAEDCFTDGLSLHEDNDDFKRLIRGKLVIEVAEMAGLSKGDINLVKRVITRRIEEWVEKWQTQPTRFKRRCMLFASTNEEHFLPPDETGQRRWLPVEIKRLDRDRIAADRDQLWAEGAALWKHRRETIDVAHGVAWQNAETLAKGRHAKYEQTDVWEATIERWLNAPAPTPGGALSPPPRTRPLTLSDVLAGAIGLNAASQDAKAEKRAARVMKALKFEPRSVRLGGEKPVRRWVSIETPREAPGALAPIETPGEAPSALASGGPSSFDTKYSTPGKLKIPPDRA